MNTTIIKDLKAYEKELETTLEEKKTKFDQKLSTQKRKLIEDYEKKLFLISQEQHDGVKAAQERAKADAAKTAKEYQTKTKKLQAQSAKKTQEAVDAIFEEFLHV